MRKRLLSLIAGTLLSFAASAQIVITEIMYNPPESGTDSTEFVELYNAGGSPVDLLNYTFTSGLTFTFTTSTVVAAGGYAVVAVDSAAFHNYFGMAPTGDFSGGLGNGGEPIALHDGSNNLVDSVNYDDTGSWPTGSSAGEPDGGGASIVLCNATSDNNDGANWSASTAPTGVMINGFEVMGSPFAADPVCLTVTTPEVNFTAATGSAMENIGMNDTIWMALNMAATSTERIYYSLTDVSATYGVDYTTNPSLATGVDSVLVNPGDSLFPIAVSITDDATYEGDESFMVQIDSVSNGLMVGATNMVTYTIMEDDASANPVIDFTTAAYSVTEGDAPFAIAISMAPAATQTDTIWVEISNGAGAVYGAGDDYTVDSTVANDTFMIIINSGDASTGFNFTVNDDALVESTENVTFNIVALSGSLVAGSTTSTIVTIQDNDIPAVPVYDIATVTTVDASGVADSLNVNCELRGVVYGENFRASSTGISFTLIDQTGGIACFDGGTTFGYTVNEGDSVVVRGNIGQFNGLTQLYLDTIILAGSGTLQAPTVVTALDETTENELVRFDSVVIVNPAQWTGSGSGFNVDVTDGTNTYQMRIDNDCNLYSMPAPSYAFRLTGIGGQFDNSSPYDAGYQILPRRDTDIDSIGVATPPAPDTVTIPEIQTPQGGIDESPYLGQSVLTSGIVTAVASNGYWIQEEVGGAFSGVYVYDPSNTPAEGDEVVIQGTVDEFFNATQVEMITSFSVVSSGNTFTITPLTSGEVGDEQYEGVMVTVFGATCTDDTSSNNFKEWIIDDGSGAIQVDDFMYTYGPVIGNAYNVTGVVNYSFSEWEILPRYIEDIEDVTSVSELVVKTIDVYPNPAKAVINVTLEEVNNAQLSIVDVTGKVVMTQNVKQGLNAVNVEGLNNGLYIVKVSAEDKVYRNTFIKN